MLDTYLQLCRRNQFRSYSTGYDDFDRRSDMQSRRQPTLVGKDSFFSLLVIYIYCDFGDDFDSFKEGFEEG